MGIELLVSIIIAAIAATGAIGSSVATNQSNKKLAEDQKDFSKDMWNQQNQYNSPQAQMSRYREAGLSPNLIYGQGSSGNASQMPTYDRAKSNIDLGTGQLSGVYNTYLNHKRNTSEIENINADTELKRREQKIKFLEAIGLEVNNQQEAVALAKSLDLYDTDIAKGELELNLLALDQTIKGQEITNKWIENNSDMIDLSYKDFEKSLDLTQKYEDIQGTKLENRMTREEWNFYKKNGQLLGNKPLWTIFAELITESKGQTGKTAESIKSKIGKVITERGARKNYRQNKRKYDNTTWGGVPKLK